MYRESTTGKFIIDGLDGSGNGEWKIKDYLLKKNEKDVCFFFISFRSAWHLKYHINTLKSYTKNYPQGVSANCGPVK